MEIINDVFAPVQKQLKMRYLEQYVDRVHQCSSRYNNSNRCSYAPINLVRKYVKYPAYGDFPETYFLRSYGNWWKKSSSTQKEYRPQDFDLLAAEDFIIVEFGSAVVPRDVCIYEVYHPGAIIRIWGKLIEGKKWYLLWEGFPQKSTRSRKFCPPIRKLNCLVNLIRIEFNQSHLEYHTSIDAILLGGFQPETELQYELINKGLVPFRISKSVTKFIVNDNEEKTNINYPTKNYFAILPDEVILHIFQYLDLRSLSRCAQVNKRWNNLSQDQSLYQSITLKIYWYLVDVQTLQHFIKKCDNIKKLDLSWCNENKISFDGLLNLDYYNSFLLLLEKNNLTITHLSLNDNCFVDDKIMRKISECEELVDLRLHNTLRWERAPFCNLTKLVTLDLSSTFIRDGDLMKILKSNPHLEHLILDLCEKLDSLDSVVNVVVQYNKKLKTWSSWKTISPLTMEGIRMFSECQNLEELDLGWCLINNDPRDCLAEIANGCKKLRRLILSEWRSLNDQLLMPIILSCKELSQLDLLGIKSITSEVCEKALFLLPKLRLLDISFCDSVRQDEVEIWRQQYPHITIQRSCECTPRQ